MISCCQAAMGRKRAAVRQLGSTGLGHQSPSGDDAGDRRRPRRLRWRRSQDSWWWTRWTFETSEPDEFGLHNFLTLDQNIPLQWLQVKKLGNNWRHRTKSDGKRWLHGDQSRVKPQWKVTLRKHALTFPTTDWLIGSSKKQRSCECPVTCVQCIYIYICICIK